MSALVLVGPWAEILVVVPGISEAGVKLAGLLVEKQLERVVALQVVVMDLRRVELVEVVVVGLLEWRLGQL